MSASTENALIDASLQLSNKKRNVRDAAMQQLAISIEYNEETNESLSVIVDRIVDALHKGCDPRHSALAIIKTVTAIPTSNAFGPVAEQLLKSLGDSSAPASHRAHIALALGWIAALVGNYSDIYYELPTVIVEGLLDALGTAVKAREAWPSISLMVSALSAAMLGLDQGCVAGWVYNRLVSILLVIIVYYPASYIASHPSHAHKAGVGAGSTSRTTDDGSGPPVAGMVKATNSPVLHALTLLITAHRACDEGEAEVFFRPKCTNSALHDEMEEVDDDDEYFYDPEDVFFAEVRYSFDGIKKKLSSLADGECEVPDVDVDGNEVRKLADIVESIMEASTLPEDSPESPIYIANMTDLPVFTGSWAKRAAYFTLLNALHADLPATALVKGTFPSILSFIENNWYLSSLLDVEEEEEKASGRSKDKAFLLARKAMNKRRNVVESARRREKYDEVVLADE